MQYGGICILPPAKFDGKSAFFSTTKHQYTLIMSM
jgi:hypothetical protein